MESVPYAEWLQTTVSIAKEAGGIIKKYWGNVQHIEHKAHKGDMVTEADRASEEYLLSALKHNFPTHSILAEEAGGAARGDYLWVGRSDRWNDKFHASVSFCRRFHRPSLSAAANSWGCVQPHHE